MLHTRGLFTGKLSTGQGYRVSLSHWCSRGARTKLLTKLLMHSEFMSLLPWGCTCELVYFIIIIVNLLLLDQLYMWMQCIIWVALWKSAVPWACQCVYISAWACIYPVLYIRLLSLQGMLALWGEGFMDSVIRNVHRQVDKRRQHHLLV